MLMHQKGLSKRWFEEGRRWLFVFQDTNPLHFRILCAVLGVSAKHGFVMNSVAIPRIPGESIGGICKLTSASGTVITLNVEYNQLEPLLKETPAGGDVPDDSGYSPYPGNINVLLFHLPRYVECLDGTGGVVPEFINPKWADPAKTQFKSSTRLECMMQDFPRLCGPNDAVGVTQFERWIAKTSVKNNLADARKKNPPECALSAEADLYSCNVRLMQLLGSKVTKANSLELAATQPVPVPSVHSLTSGDLRLAGAQIEEPEEVSYLGITAKIGAKSLGCSAESWDPSCDCWPCSSQDCFEAFLRHIYRAAEEEVERKESCSLL